MSDSRLPDAIITSGQLLARLGGARGVKVINQHLRDFERDVLAALRHGAHCLHQHSRCPSRARVVRIRPTDRRQ